ncbi:ABC transporter permease [bacterium]|nr:ABC transporter permease [bacterium]
MGRLAYVLRKEFTQLRRDKMMPRMILFAPVLQLVLFGYAATSDVRNVPVAVYDGDRSADSRLIVEEIAHSYYFHLVPAAQDPRDLERQLLTGKAQIGLHIPPDFHRDLMLGKTPQIGLLVDGTDSNTAGVAAAYLQGILRQRSLQFQTRQSRADGSFGVDMPILTPEPRVWFNDELKSINFMVPGVVGLILLVLTVNLAALSIVRERETGTLEQLMVTPLRSYELLLGKMIPYGLLTLLDSGVIVLVARLWFHVPLRGSLVLLFAMAAVFLVTNLGLGLLISAVSRTQQEAQILAFLLIMPSVLLSGFMFPIQNMPEVVQWATYLIPFRYFLEIARGLFLKGVGVAVLWPQMLVLSAFALALLGAGVAAFKKRL